MTDPVGEPLVPETVMVTLRLCAVVTLVDAGATLTEGVVGFTVVPPLPPLPPLHAQTGQTTPIERMKRKSLAKRFI